MSKVIAKLLLQDGFGNPTTLLVFLKDDGTLAYRLSGTKTRVAHAISNLQVTEPLPDVMAEYTNRGVLVVAIADSVRSGTKTVLKAKLVLSSADCK